MTETRGYETINDRSAGWGPGVDAEAQPTEDADKEVVAERAARQKQARKQGNPGVNPDTQDRKRGKGAAFNPTSGADAGYGVGAWEGSDGAVGADYVVEYTGSNTADNPATNPEYDVANRAAKDLPTSDLTPPDVDTIGSIVDRRSGWGHKTGNQSDRKDA